MPQLDFTEPKFDGDQSAQAWVIEQASRGSRLHLLAVYRSHDFISRAYGNYLGLGRVLHFVAQESGVSAGELTCVSASATAEITRGGSFGRQRVHALLEDCQAALAVTP